MKKKLIKNQYKYNLRIRSKIHKDVYHFININLYCYEKMPNEESLSNTIHSTK